MKKINNIVISNTAPNTWDLWIYKKAIKIFGDNGWEDLIPDVSNALTKESADKLYQPKGTYLTSIPSNYITEEELSSKGYITTVPAATTSKIGGIKKGSAVADTDVSEEATIQTVGTTLNTLLAQLRTIGVLNS